MTERDDMMRAVLPPLHVSEDRSTDRDGYEYGADGYGVPSAAVDAVIRRWAGLHPGYLLAVQQNQTPPPHKLVEWATETLRGAGSGIAEARNLARLATNAAIRKVFTDTGGRQSAQLQYIEVGCAATEAVIRNRRLGLVAVAFLATFGMMQLCIAAVMLSSSWSPLWLAAALTAGLMIGGSTLSTGYILGQRDTARCWRLALDHIARAGHADESDREEVVR